MTNLEILRTRLPDVDACWNELMTEPRLPLVILAQRGGQVSVIVSITSSNLLPVWARFRPSEPLPENFAQLAQITTRLGLDVTAVRSGAENPRLYAQVRDFTDGEARASAWPCDFNFDLEGVALGIYAGLSQYKYYRRDPEALVVKLTYDGGSLVSTTEEQAQDQPTNEDLALFGLEGLDLDWTRGCVQARVDGTASYITLWN